MLGTQNKSNQTKEEKTEKLSEYVIAMVFNPEPLIDLYEALVKYISDRKNQPTETFLLSSLSTTIQSYVGLPTHKVYAEKAMREIENSVGCDLLNKLRDKRKERKPLEEEYWFDGQGAGYKNIDLPLRAAVFNSLLGINEIRRAMPSEFITPLFGGGSEARKMLTDTIKYYSPKLAEYVDKELENLGKSEKEKKQAAIH